MRLVVDRKQASGDEAAGLVFPVGSMRPDLDSKQKSGRIGAGLLPGSDSERLAISAQRGGRNCAEPASVVRLRPRSVS